MGDRTAVVTGGSKGLGLAITTYLVSQGWQVHTISRTRTESLQHLCDCGTVTWTQVDAADPQQVAAYCEQLSAADDVSLLINNIGALSQGLFATATPEELARMTEINYLTPLKITHAAARAMIANGGGQIINISTINVVRGYKGVATYTSAKAGIDGLVRPLARELGPLGITINSIVPGYFDSDLTTEVTPTNRTRIQNRTPLGRLGNTSDVIAVIKYLVETEELFMTGQHITIDGGISC